MFAENALVAETPRLQKFALRLTGNKADADDLVQSTFLRALEKADYFQDGTSLRKWSSKIMFNLFVTEYRRKTKFETQYDPEPYLHAKTVEAAQESQTDLHHIGTVMESLAQHHREILMMVCVQDMPYQDVAEILGIPVGTVRSRLSRARENLQTLLDDGQKAAASMPPHIAAASMQHRKAA